MTVSARPEVLQFPWTAATCETCKTQRDNLGVGTKNWMGKDQIGSIQKSLFLNNSEAMRWMIPCHKQKEDKGYDTCESRAYKEDTGRKNRIN